LLVPFVFWRSFNNKELYIFDTIMEFVGLIGITPFFMRVVGPNGTYIL
jgi:hypothetical protein